MSTNTVETAIGAAVILIAAGFFGFAYATSGAGGIASGYQVEAEFDNVSGIHTGTDVRLAGIKIGTVVAQKLNPENYQAQVTMALDPAVKLTDDSTAKITSEGLLGANFIALDPGGSETFIADGGVIANTQGAVDIWTLISSAMFEGKGKEAKPAAGDAPPPAGTEQPQQ